VKCDAVSLPAQDSVQTLRDELLEINTSNHLLLLQAKVRLTTQ
jgi:hypothetical protein